MSKVLPENASREGHGGGLRAVARPPAYRTPGLLSPALAGQHAAGGDHRRLPAAAAGGKIRSLGGEQLRRLRSGGSAVDRRARRAWSATRCSTTWASGPSSTRCCPGARSNDLAVVGYSPFGHGDFPGPRTREGRVLQEIAAAHGATPRQVALALPGAPARRSSPSPRPRHPITCAKMPAPASCA